MTTARDVVHGAMRLLAIHAAGESPTSAESADGLDALNQMLHEWKAQGIDLQHDDVALDDDLSVPPDHIRAIRYNLAGEIAPEYGRQPSVLIAAIADRTFRGLRNQYADPRQLRADKGMRVRANPNLQESSYDITSDT